MTRLRLAAPVQIANASGEIIYEGVVCGLTAVADKGLRISIQPEPDFVEEVTAEWTAANPDFPAMVAGAESDRAAISPLSCQILQGHNFLLTGSTGGRGEKVFCTRCATVNWV